MPRWRKVREIPLAWCPMPAAGYVLGIDGGTEGLRCGVFRCSDGAEVAYSSSPYQTTFPHPGWAEQQPEDWWTALVAAVRAALAKAESAGVAAAQVGALCVDTTCCTVCALRSDGTPLRPCLLWMDMRSAQQANRIAASGDLALRVNGAGTSAVSAEWFLCKALWLKEHEPETWAAATHVCEYQDYINLRLTGHYVGSTNNAAIRWHFQGGTVPPVSLLAALDCTDLLDKWPSVMVAPGSPIGAGLTLDAAAALGLPAGLPVAQGGADAFIGMLGLGVHQPGHMALLTGSSHLHLGVCSQAAHAPGVWGTYAGVFPLMSPGHAETHIIEGGQTSTGSVAAWTRRLLCPDDMPSSVAYQQLDALAEAVPPGCEGLICQEFFQGNRTPHTDAAARGCFLGLTLSHGKAHVWRSVLEGVAFGTRLILDTMRSRAAFVPERIVIAGGAARSQLWLQIHADVTGVPLVVTQCGEAPALGCAILAATCCGAHASLVDAVHAMVHPLRVVEPDLERHDMYKPFFLAYCRAYEATKGVVAAAATAAAETQL